MSLTVSVMQPYFFPYAGYYRLLALADVFVIYDCVQFPRSGYVHRNRLSLIDGAPDWLTLPIEKCPRSTLISDLRFQDDALSRFRTRARRFPSLTPLLEREHAGGVPREIVDALFDFDRSPVAYLERTLTVTAAAIGVSPRIIRSSTFALGPQIRGQDRILEIVRALHGTRYLNAPGGESLYDGEYFRARGVELAFLPRFAGPPLSALEILLTSGAAALRAQVTGV
jgi:WbqC-like protein family